MRKRRRRLLALCVAVSIVVGVLTACGESSTTGEEAAVVASEGDRVLPGGLVVPEGKTTSLTIQAEMDIGTLNPWGVNNMTFALMGLNVHERLFEYSPDGTIIPFLVKNYEWIDDKVLECTIYDNIHDSEGNPFTTSDILFCLEQAKDSVWSGKTAAIDYENIKIVDDYTIDIGFSNASVLVYDSLACINMVTQAAYENSGDDMETSVVGLGTYKVESYTAGTELVLTANDNYWMTEENVEEGATRYNQNVDKIYIKVIADETQRTVEFDAGTIDVLYSTPNSAVAGYSSDSSVNAFSEVQSLSNMLFFNCSEKSVMNNADLRRACAYALNNEEINIGAFDSVYVPATQLANPKTEEYEEGIEQYPYDLEKAKECLATAGYKSDELTLHLIYPTGHELVAQIVQSQLSQIGINVEVEEVDSTNITNIVNNEMDSWDLNVNQCAQNSGTLLFYFYNLLNGEGTSRGFWTNDEYQQYLNSALKGDDDAKEKAYQIVVDECVSYAIAYQTYWHITKSGIKNPIICNNTPIIGNWEYTEAATWLIDD